MKRSEPERWTPPRRWEDDRGTIAPGQHADLVILEQAPSADIRAVGTTVLVFKDGQPDDPTALRAPLEGLIDIP